jgi:hypothetical protein
MVVYGMNGAGKSSFVDAVEYVLHNGKLAHLAHEYSGRNQEKAIPNTHTPADRNTEFCITFLDGAALTVKIARNGTHIKNGADAIKMDTWDYRRTALRQDEVAEFIRSRKGDKYSALLPLFGLHELEVAAENLRQLAQSIEKQSKLGQKQGELKAVGIKRKQVFGDSDDAAITAKEAELHKKYCPASATAEALAQCIEIETALKQRINDLTAEKQRYLAFRVLADADLAGAVKAVRQANAKLAGSVEPLITEKLEVLQSADLFAGKLSDGKEVACPACGRAIAVELFKAHVTAEQDRLAEIIAIFNERRAAIVALIDMLKTIKATLAKADIKSWRDALRTGPLKANLEWLEACNPEELRQAATEESLKQIETHGLPILKAADAASKDAPPEIKELSDDKTLAEAAKAVFEAIAPAAEIATAERLIAFVDAVEVGVRKEIRERSEKVITEISGDISDMWKILHPGEPIEDVHLYLPDDDKAIDIALKFHGKEQDSPRLTLSEGYRNSLGLCIFLAMAKREAGNDRPLLLDDVVVSFDRSHRGMIVELLQKEFATRQVVIFTHDRDWYAELRKQLDEAHWVFRTLLPYQTPAIGIRWSHKTTTFDDARKHLTDRPDSAGNDARKIMDVELSLIAEKLQVRLPYLRGDSNDRRMWSEFLDRIGADGKKCFQKKSGTEYPPYAEGLALLDTASRLLGSWANKGSHTFDLMRPEAVKLIDACEAALGSFICKGCTKHLWFSHAENQEWVQCQCGELRWRYGKG